MLSRTSVNSSTLEIPRGNHLGHYKHCKSVIQNDFLNFVMDTNSKHTPEFLLNKHHPTNKVGVRTNRTQSYGTRCLYL